MSLLSRGEVQPSLSLAVFSRHNLELACVEREREREVSSAHTPLLVKFLSLVHIMLSLHARLVRILGEEEQP